MLLRIGGKVTEGTQCFSNAFCAAGTASRTCDDCTGAVRTFLQLAAQRALLGRFPARAGRERRGDQLALGRRSSSWHSLCTLSVSR